MKKCILTLNLLSGIVFAAPMSNIVSSQFAITGGSGVTITNWTPISSLSLGSSVNSANITSATVNNTVNFSCSSSDCNYDISDASGNFGSYLGVNYLGSLNRTTNHNHNSYQVTDINGFVFGQLNLNVASLGALTCQPLLIIDGSLTKTSYNSPNSPSNYSSWDIIPANNPDEYAYATTNNIHQLIIDPNSSTASNELNGGIICASNQQFGQPQYHKLLLNVANNNGSHTITIQVPNAN
jgi:hypothetical protein